MSETTMTHEGAPRGKLPDKKIDLAKNKSRIKSEVGRVSLKAAALIMAGILGAFAGIGYAIHEHNGAGIHQDVDIPSTFDPNTIDSMVSGNNSVQMTFEDYEKNILPSLPLWDKQSETATTFVPVLLNNNHIAPLHIEKTESLGGHILKNIVFSGFEEGEVVISPLTGTFKIFPEDALDLPAFSIYSTDTEGEDINVWFSTAGLNPIIDLNGPLIDGRIEKHVEKGQPIGSLLTSNQHPSFKGQLKMTINAPLLKHLNLATTPGGKLIQIVKKVPETIKKITNQTVAFVRRIY